MLDMRELREHLLSRGIVDDDVRLVCTPLTGGVSGDVVAVTGGGCPLVVKQALPKLRVAEDWFAGANRIVTEANALELVGQLTPELVPPVYDIDPETFTLVLKRSPVEWNNWREELLAGHVDEGIGRRLGCALATWHSATMSNHQALDRFSDLTAFRQLRIAPFHEVVADRNPDLRPDIEKVVHELVSVQSCLVHGDFSPKNILVGAGGVWVLDWEVAHLGNPVFDVAFLLTHLLLKAVKRPADSAAYLAVAREFLAAYASQGEAPELDAIRVQANTGCLMLARVDGKSPVPYLTHSDADLVRVIGKRLLVEPFADVLEAWGAVR